MTTEHAPDPRALAALDLEAHLGDPARKQAFVTPMFDVIAARYDDFTRLFSFGMDAVWKRDLLGAVRPALRPGGVCLDLACGTGDLAFAMRSAEPGAVVTGIDASPQMIAQALTRGAALGVQAPAFEVGDAMRLGVADGSVDVITAGYCYRNTPDYRAALAEAARALKPGGVLATLDFYRPEQGVWRALLLGYLRIAGDLVGWAWHRVPVVYGYIAPSIDHFVSWQQYSRDLEAVGLTAETPKRWLLGGVALHVARKK